jgi:hypothetical protein
MEVVPFDSGRWRIDDDEHRLEEHLGRPSLYLAAGSATLPDVRLQHGAIEFDLAFGRVRSFSGAIWRVQDDRNLETFYLRPHQSGNPDATQYTPVSNGVAGWQLYHGPRYTVALDHAFDEWTRVRIEFAGVEARIFVGAGDRPVLVVDELKREVAPGSVGVSGGGIDGSGAHFADFRFEPLPAGPLPRPREPAANGVVTVWDVSDAFDEALLDRSGGPPLAGRSWTRLESEPSGLTDLARVQGLERGNTALARAVVRAEREQVARVDLGFSDRVRVYLNGRPAFAADDTYRSRDYRFLGSIGWFDALYLPLANGENELVLAVSEDFGGWGVQARFPAPEGLSIPGWAGPR